MKKKNTGFILLLIAFFEGGAVMACELFSAKMIAPFFGTTIYSWAAVLAITLFALAGGYYVGGILTKKFHPVRLLAVILLSSGLFLFLMPYTGTLIMMACKEMNLLVGLVISLLVFVLPPILFFGMVSPVIIHHLVYNVDVAGSTAGKVYAVSTIGGVLSTLFLGFYIIPEFGIRMPAFIYGAFMILLPIALLLPRKGLFISISVLAFAIFFQSYTGKEDRKNHQVFDIVYSSEGLLGQVKVLDGKSNMAGQGQIYPRGLLVNNTWQSLINKTDQISLLDYVYFINPLLSKYPEGSGVLLVGLGGGTMAKEIHKKGLELEVVELDPRLKDISVEYFGMDASIPVIVDDGRHYLERTKKTYDIIILDAFLGENPPWHLLTLQSFQRVKELLKPGGTLILEFFGFIEGEMGAGSRSVYHTMQNAGFTIDLIGTRENKNERNFIFVGTENGFDFAGLDYNQKTYSNQRIEDLRDYIFDISDIDMGDAIMLTDDVPVLEKLLMKPSLHWRKDLNEIFRNRILEDNWPIYY